MSNVSALSPDPGPSTVFMAVSISDAVDDISNKLGSDWKLSDLFNKRNVTASYAELEWD